MFKLLALRVKGDRRFRKASRVFGAQHSLCQVERHRVAVDARVRHVKRVRRFGAIFRFDGAAQRTRLVVGRTTRLGCRTSQHPFACLLLRQHGRHIYLTSVLQAIQRNNRTSIFGINKEKSFYVQEGSRTIFNKYVLDQLTPKSRKNIDTQLASFRAQSLCSTKSNLKFSSGKK